MNAFRKRTVGIAASLAVAVAASGLIGLSLAHAADLVIDVAAGASELASAAAGSNGAFSVAGDVITVVSGPARITGSSTTRRIVISGGTEASPLQVTLAGLALTSGSGATAISLAGTSTARFILDGSTTLIGNATQPGLAVPPGTAVGIDAAPGGLTAQLTATASGQAAAIGGDGNAAVVNSSRASLVLSGVAAASCGKVTLNGGSVEATSSGLGAAIGGGAYGGGCAVTVNGGTLVARGTGAGVGIGGGAGAPGIADYQNDSPGGAAQPVVVNGGTVTAQSAKSAAIGGGSGGEGIGPTSSGTNGAVGTLTVKAGSVKLTPDSGRDTCAPITGGTGGSQPVALAKVAAPSVQSVTVDGVDFKVGTNHPSDNQIYLYLPHVPGGTENYTVAASTSSGSTSYSVKYRAAGGAPAVAAITRILTATAPTFTAVTTPYAQPVAQALSLKNTGTGTVQVSGITSSDSSFVLAGVTNLSIGAGATNTAVTVRPAASLPVGIHTATITVTYDGTTTSTATASLSFEVKAGNPTSTPTNSSPAKPTPPTSTSSAPGPGATTTAPAPRNSSTAGKTPTQPVLKPLKFAKPKLKGTAKAGKKLKVVRGSWTKGTKFTYKWYRNGKPIKKANKSSYKLTKADRGKKITVKVTGSKPGYFTKTVKSKAKKVAK